jgi:hypothetical protein
MFAGRSKRDSIEEAMRRIVPWEQAFGQARSLRTLGRTTTLVAPATTTGQEPSSSSPTLARQSIRLSLLGLHQHDR